MDRSAFKCLTDIADLVERQSAEVPVAHRYIEYWYGAAFEVLGTRCVASMQEARKIVDLTPTISIPGAKSWVRGLANIGGRVLSIADLTAFISDGASTSAGKQALVVSGRGIHSGLVIDVSFGGVRFPIEEMRKDLPVAGRLRPYISGVFRSDDGDYAVFNIERLLGDPDFMQAGVITTN